MDLGLLMQLDITSRILWLASTPPSTASLMTSRLMPGSFTSACRATTPDLEQASTWERYESLLLVHPSPSLLYPGLSDDLQTDAGKLHVGLNSYIASLRGSLHGEWSMAGRIFLVRWKK